MCILLTTKVLKWVASNRSRTRPKSLGNHRQPIRTLLLNIDEWGDKYTPYMAHAAGISDKIMSFSKGFPNVNEHTVKY